MSTYILQSGLFLLAFWLIYILFLKRETFFTYNRIYLLVTPILAAVLPLFKINFFESYTEKAQEILVLPAVFIGKNQAEVTLASKSVLSETTFIQEHFLSILYVAGLLLMFAFFIRKLLKFLQFSKQGKAKCFEDYRWVEVPNTKVACTFLHTIYLGSELSEKEKQHILKHEKTHAKQRHTYDLLYFELLKIVSWFNPVVFFYQHEMNQIHEYIADQQATKDADKLPYYQSLLNLAFGSSNISFINQFFNHSLIKKRIKMLEKTKSTRSALLKFLVLVPAIMAMLFVVSCTDEAVKESQDSAVSELTHQELLDKYSKEIEEMEAEGKDFMEIQKSYFPYKKEEDNNAVYSREDYYKVQAFMTWMNNKMREEGKDVPDYKVKTYEEYKKEKAMLPPPPPPPPFPGSYSIKEIDKVPAYQGCEGLGTFNETYQCTATKIAEYVINNFDNKKIAPLNLEKGSQRIYVKFVIGKTGEVINVKARASNEILADEAKRLIESLPPFIPGENKGEKVNVEYALPIIYKTE
ncbi:M56 family metallopeptidase [Mesonia sp. K7]|uniref:M56 family metallopeptidase n=1 Tax=Mesonia sp. K7 TaxID=2218606 RepID=UPI000DA7F57D|nr:M56 family metallopeptidase [Mesonia sp. K7]PZD76978.1 hypothetical protein DNG35_10060 [Mesonia sp. K7]